MRYSPVMTITRPAKLDRIEHSTSIVGGMADPCWLMITPAYDPDRGGRSLPAKGTLCTVDGVRMSTGRAALLFAGFDGPRDMIGCHICDVPRCVNPHHLFLGTHTHNRWDCRLKRRMALSEPDLATAAAVRRLTLEVIAEHGRDARQWPKWSFAEWASRVGVADVVDLPPMARPNNLAGGRKKRVEGEPTRPYPVNLTARERARWDALAAKLGKKTADVVRDEMNAACDRENIPRE